MFLQVEDFHLGSEQKNSNNQRSERPQPRERRLHFHLCVGNYQGARQQKIGGRQRKGSILPERHRPSAATTREQSWKEFNTTVFI